jgi:hypothetical protein
MRTLTMIELENTSGSGDEKPGTLGRGGRIGGVLLAGYEGIKAIGEIWGAVSTWFERTARNGSDFGGDSFGFGGGGLDFGGAPSGSSFGSGGSNLKSPVDPDKF